MSKLQIVTIAPRAVFFLCLGLVAAGSFAALRNAPAAAAPAIDSSPPLTISRKPLTSLSSLPGMRIAKISAQEGETCFRVSRSRLNGAPTLSETFCSYE